MNKKLMALAIAGAFVAPVAMADTSNVVIGGQMHFSFDSLNGLNAAGNDLTRKSNVSSNASNIYFKGSEDLGNGLSAIFQVQTYFSAGGTGVADVGGQGAGITNTQSVKDGVGSGNTFVGLKSNSMGTVILGKNDSPVKTLSRKVDLFNNQIGDTRNLTAMASPGGAAPGSIPGNSAGWDLRPANQVAYYSPSFSGFGFNAAYITNLGSTATIDSGTVNNPNAVSAWSTSATYENGPIFAGLGYETHKMSDFNTAVSSNHNDENIWRASGGYNFGSFKLVGLYQRERDMFVNSSNNSAERNVWGLGGAYNFMGANTIKLQYYKASSIKNTNIANMDQTGAKLWAVGFDHALSKRTTVYAAYARTNNDSWANYSAFGGGHGDNPGTTTPNGTTISSKNPSGISVGVIHNF